jgi:hypothetical protein
MRNKTTAVLTAILFISMAISAQVQVSKEPLHKNVLENKYLRLLNVWIPPGDTTQFHIHSTPSVFLLFTNTVTCSQLKGEEWEKGTNIAGDAFYESFLNKPRVHRVSNCDTVPFHVTDIELLSSFKPDAAIHPLPFTVLFDNEKVIAYRFTKNDFTTSKISNRGPMVAGLIEGDKVFYVDAATGNKKEIKSQGYLYIEPGASFSFSFSGKEKLNMVLFEIK